MGFVWVVINYKGCAHFRSNWLGFPRTKPRAMDRDDDDSAIVAVRDTTLEDVSHAASALSRRPLHQQEVRRVWGPVSPEEASACGALHGATSVLLCLVMNPVLQALVRAVRAVIPQDILPRDNDDAQTLAQRLASSDFLDDIHFPVGGHGRGGRTRRLNATTWPQPRRVTWSVPTTFGANWFFAYTQARRAPDDWRCRVMPFPVFELMMYLWQIARPYLGAVSGAAPPTAIQLCIYYVLFGCNMVRHRDNHNTADFARLMGDPQAFDHHDQPEQTSQGHSPTADQNSQVVGSDVLIWTDGNTPMSLTLSFPPQGDRCGSRSTYVIHPKFGVPCEFGTLFIFTPHDDLRFCHEAHFREVDMQLCGSAGCRFAYVVRWLQSARQFQPEAKHAMVLTPHLQKVAAERKKKRADKAKREREQALRAR